MNGHCEGTRSCPERSDALGEVEAVNSVSEPHLPQSLKAWLELQKPKNGDHTGRLAWEYLRPFFRLKCYDLYAPWRDEMGRLKPWLLAPVQDTMYNLPCDRNGVYGCRRYTPYFYSINSRVWPARNRYDEDVVIKVISCGDEGANELAVLKYLSREPLRSQVDNPAVPVLEFIEYESFTFAVFPRWGECTQIPFVSVTSAMSFCVQVTRGLAFLHKHLIAHLDIATENVMMNHLGHHELQEHHNDPAELRSRCPLRYGIIDFDCSVRFEPTVDVDQRRVTRLVRARLTRAPETQKDGLYDPFAADVYQTAQMLLHLFYDMTGVSPRFLYVLRDMSFTESEKRISMEEAHRRFSDIENGLNEDDVNFCLNTQWVVPGSLPMPHDEEFAGGLRRYLRAEKLKSGLYELTRPTPKSWTGAKCVDEDSTEEMTKVIKECIAKLDELLKK